MTERPTRGRTGDAHLDELVAQLLDATGAVEDIDQLREMLVSVVGLARDDVTRLDRKIVNAALQEMSDAFRVFAPYREVPKVTIFGSARTLPEDPLYAHARNLAAALADRGWMVVTGAGPGIMAAGSEGAGRERSLGVNIRLPFEQAASELLDEQRLVTMKYFFTRKLMLMKESHAFVVLPGGFGTLDEAFELLTLEQTGKADPKPIVMVEVPGGRYWHEWDRLVSHVAERGLISDDDRAFYMVTDDVAAVVEEVTGFYRNYHSMRWVGERLVLRLMTPPTEEELAGLSTEFADIVTSGGIEATAPRSAEVRDGDNLDRPRVMLRFDRHHSARLRILIDRLNALPSAPEEASPPPSPDESR